MPDTPKSIADAVAAFGAAAPAENVAPQSITDAVMKSGLGTARGPESDQPLLNNSMALGANQERGPQVNTGNSANIDAVGMSMFPKDVFPETHFDAVKALSKNFTFMPTSGNASRQLKALADIDAMDIMEDSGLDVDDASNQELFKKLRGASLLHRTLRHARMMPEEVGPVFKRFANTLGDQIVQKAQAELHVAQQEIADLQANPSPFSSRHNPLRLAQQRATKLAEALAAGKSMQALSDDPQMQATLLHTIKTRGQDRADGARNEKEMLEGAQIQDIFSIGIGDVFPDISPNSYGPRNELAKRMRAAIDTIVIDPSDSKGANRLITDLALGAVEQQRMATLGVPAEVAGSISPRAVPFITHPSLIEDVVLAKARKQAMVELGQRGKKITREELAEKVESLAPRMQDRSMRQLLFGGQKTRLDAFRLGATPGEAALDGSDAILSPATQSVMRTFGDVISGAMDGIDTAVKSVEDLVADPTPAEGDLLALRRANAAIIGAKGASEEMDKASKEADKVWGAETIGQNIITFGPEGARVQGEQTRTSLDPEVRKDILNPDGSLLRDMGAAFWPELAPQVLERTAALGLDPAAFRHIYAKQRDEFVREGMEKTIFTGTKEEDATRAFKQFQQTQAKYEQGRAGMGDMFRDSWTAGIAGVGTLWRETLKAAITNPEELTVEAVSGLGLSKAGTLIVKRVGKTQMVENFVAGAVMKRATKVLDEAMVADPQVVARVRDFTSRLANRSPQTRLATLQSSVDTLDALLRKNRLDPAAADPLKPLQSTVNSLRNDVRDAARVTEKFTPEEISDLMSDLKMGDTVREWVSNPSRLELGLSLLGRDVAKLHGRTKKHLRFNTELNRDDIATLVAERDYLDIGDLPISPLMLADDSARGFWSRIVGPSAQTGGTLAKLVNFVSERSSLLRAGKFRNAQNRTNAELLMDISESAQRGRMHDLTIARRAAQGDQEHAALDLIRQEIVDATQDVQVLRRAMEADPSVAMRLSRAAAFDRMTLDEMFTGLSTRNSDWEFFARLADEGEGLDDFNTRLNDIIETDMGMADLVEPEVVEAFRKRFLREFLDSEDVGKVTVDPLGEGSTRQGSGVRINEKILEGLDDATASKVLAHLDDPEDILGINIRDDLNTIARLSSTSKAMRSLLSADASPGTAGILMGQLIRGANELDDHTGTVQVKAAKNLGLSMALTSRVLTERVKRMTRTFNNMPEGDRKILENALLAQEKLGVNAPLRELMDNPDFDQFFKNAMPTHDQAIENLLKDMTDFRANVLDSAREAGLITEQQWLRMMRPYASTRFGAHQRHKLRGIGGDSKAIEIPAAQGIPDSEFVTPRAKDQWKVAVRNNKGGAEFDELFDTQEAAEAYVVRNFGTVEGVGPNGENIKLLEPITDQDFLDLEVINPAGSTFEAMKDMVIDLERMKFIKSLDVQGATLTGEGLAVLRQAERHGARGAFKASDYTARPLPNVPRRFGIFAGKHVHKKMLRQVSNWTDGAVSIRHTMDAVKAVVDDASTLKRTLAKTGQGLMNLSKRYKQAITTFQIAMNPAVIAANALSDRLIFGRAAAGRGFNTTVDGFSAHRDAWNIIRNWEDGKLRLADLPDDVRFAIENNIHDDALFGLKSSIDPELSRAKTGRSRPGSLESFKQAFGAFSDPEVKRLMHRQTKILNIIRRTKNPERVTDLEIEFDTISAKIRSEDGRLAKLQARGSHLLDSTLAEGGLGGDISLGAKARGFYGNVSNSTRLAAYLYQTRKGVPPSVAMERVNTFMQTYSRIPKFVKQAQQLPFVNPVVSFPYEAARIMMNMAKENPAFLMGMVAASPALNSVSIAASGVDPTVAMQNLTRDTNAAYLPLEMMGTLAVPDAEGHLVTFEVPGLNLLKSVLGGGPGGIFGGAADAFEGTGDDGLIASMSQGAMRLGNSYIGNSPVTAPLMQLFGQRDVFGNKYADQNAAMSAIAKQQVELFTPTWMPYIGKWHNRMVENLRGEKAGKYAYSDRTRDLVTTALSNVTGIKVRGGSLKDFVPETAKGLVEMTGKALMLSAGIPPSQFAKTERRIWGEGGFQERDYMAMVFIESAQADIDAPNPERPDNPLSSKINAAVSMSQDPDPELAEHGREMLADLRDDYVERVSNLRKEEGNTSDAFLNQVKRFASETDLLEKYSGYTTVRKAHILSQLIRHGRPPEKLNEYAQAFILTSAGDVRKPTRREAVRRARGMLDDALRINPSAVSSPFVPAIQALFAENGALEAMAGVKERIDTTRDTQRAAALDIIDKLRK